MIDIHNHILPSIDDGSSALDTSIFLLKEASNLGVKKIICTPHFDKEIYPTNLIMIKESLETIASFASELNIDLYLGQEIMCYEPNELLEMIPNNDIIPLSSSRYFLLEFPYYTYIDISEAVYNASLFDYGVVVAHIERYQYVDIEEVRSLKKLGALIQVNAESIVKPLSFKNKRFVKKLLDENLVDFIASDIHQNRTNYLKKAYDKIQKKYGEKRAEELFKGNAEKYLLNLK